MSGLEPNAGQADPSVRFVARGQRYTALLKDRELDFVPQSAVPAGKDRSLSAIRLEFLGANSNPEIRQRQQLAGKSNYFFGRDPAKWVSNVSRYGRVEYGGLYPGIDVAYHNESGQLEFDFILKPGALTSDITLRLGGSETVRLSPEGDLLLKAPDGVLHLHKPVVYQRSHGVKTIVRSDYRIAGNNLITFRVGKYDPARELVIDPRISFSTDLGSGGFGLDSPRIALDSAANVYITGNLGSVPTTPGAFRSTGGGLFVSKLSADGSSLLYSTYIASGQFASIAVNPATGEAFIAGITDDTAFPVTPNAYQSSLPLGGASFLSELSSDGSKLLYSTLLGRGITTAYAIAVDSQGIPYMTGSSDSMLSSTGRPFAGGSKDAFVAKFDPTKSGNSSLVYLTYLGGSGSDQGKAVAVDSSGRAWIAGSTDSLDFPSSGGFQPANAGAIDAFVTLLGADGSTILYSSFLGGSGLDQAEAIAIENSGIAYVTGYTQSANFPTKNAYQVAFGSGGADAFVTKIDSSAAGQSSLVYSTYLGGSGSDGGNAIAFDANRNVYVAGSTTSVDFPVVHPMFSRSNVFVTQSGFITEFSATGSPLLLSTLIGGAYIPGRFGGQGNTNSTGLAIDGAGNIIVAGGAERSTESGDEQTNFPVTPGAFQTGMQGGTRFLLKIAPDDGPALAVVTGHLDFPAAAQKANSSPQTITVFDAGTQPLAINSFQTTGDFTQSNTCSTSIAAASYCSVTVAFAPTAIGNRSGTLTINDNAPGSPHTISLSGLGLSNGNPSLSPIQNFGTVAVNSSVSQLATLTNLGTGPMSITAVATSGDFSEINNCPAQLGAGANCSIRVTFTPTATGSRQGTIQITTDAAAGATTQNLGGSAILAPGILLDPAALFFGQQSVGTSSSAQTVKLTNNGSAPLNIVSLSSSGDFAQTSNCVGSIQPARSCTISVTFSPTATGIRYGQISIDDNATGHPHAIPLTGGLSSSSSSTFALFPASPPPSATVTAGQTATYNFSIVSTADLSGVVSIACSGAPSASTCAPTPANITLGPFSSSNTFSVSVKTTARTSAAIHFMRFHEISWLAVLFVPLITFVGRGPLRYRAILLTLLCAAALVACGGGGSGSSSPSNPGPQGTPGGTYTLTVTGNYTNGTSQSATLTLVVQ